MTMLATIEPPQRCVAVPAWGARSSNRTPEPIRKAIKNIMYGMAPEQLRELCRTAGIIQASGAR